MRDDFKQNRHSMREISSRNRIRHSIHLKIKKYDTSEGVKYPKVHSYKS